MKGNQFPLISNSCTTGHKLQGCTVDDILVNSWHYAANWVYVVLSRVRTMAGLYIREPLSKDLSKYKKPSAMKQMIESFKERIGMKMLSEDDYAALEAIDHVMPENPGRSVNAGAGTSVPF